MLFFFINAKIAQYDIAALRLIFQKRKENRFCIWSHRRHLSSDQSCLDCRQKKQILYLEPPQTYLIRSELPRQAEKTDSVYGAATDVSRQAERTDSLCLEPPETYLIRSELPWQAVKTGSVFGATTDISSCASFCLTLGWNLLSQLLPEQPTLKAPAVEPQSPTL